MARDEALAPFARGIHQDVMIGLTGLEDLAEELLSGMTPAEREAFRLWLAKALRTLTPAEMRSSLNRMKAPIGFSSKAAHALFRAVADRLDIP
jgi:hypothetical protein